MNDLIDEIYLTISFSVCINASHTSMENASHIINNIYACIMVIVIVIWPLFIANKVGKCYKLMAD